MANKTLFCTRGASRMTPAPNTINEAGGAAYSLTDKAALAQFAVTGTFNSTFYVDATDQLKQVEALAQKVDSLFIAKLAVYARENGKMKDMPAYLLAVLAARGEIDLVKAIFNRVCNNSKMLFNFVQIIRSGSVGRKSFGTAVKRLIQNWITDKQGKALYLASVGHADPSLADVIKMVHPHPVDEHQQNMFSYLLGRPYQEDMLDDDLVIFEQLKRGETVQVPDLPFQSITNCNISLDQWKEVARNMSWNTLRMNLNNLHRKGVFGDRALVHELAEKLADPTLVRKFNVFPYQLMTAYQHVEDSMPTELTNALQQAMETAVENVPAMPGDTMVAIDVSGSMSSPITGRRAGSTSKTRCVDVASLIACSLLRKNKGTVVLAFDCGYSHYYGRVEPRKAGSVMSGVYLPDLNPFDAVMTNANKLATYGGGGTDCSLPFQYLNSTNTKVDNIILVSDNESWAGRAGGACAEWHSYAAKHRNAKLANIDIQPTSSTQVPDKSGKVLNIGGWSDTVFAVLNEFFKRDPSLNFASVIESIEI